MIDPVAAFIRENQRWLLIGVGGWTLAALLNALMPALARVSTGTPLGESFQAFGPRILAVGAAAVLSPLVFLAFEWLIAPGRSSWRNALLYVLIGVAYWVFSCLLMVGFASVGLLPPPVDPALLRTELFWAYFASTGFNLPILYLLMVLCYQVARHMREIRQQEVQAARLQAELSSAQAAELRTRLNPDFLFQTFDVASDLMQRNRLAARRVLSDFSEILRVSLGRDGEQRIALRDEIGLVERYLDIQNARLEDRLEVRFDIAEEALSTRVPPLLLQPLVESCVDHADERRRLEVTARRDRGRLHLAVIASGQPQAPRPDPSVREALELSSVRARLRLIYGDAAELTFASSPGAGGRIEVSIPDHPENGSPHE